MYCTVYNIYVFGALRASSGFYSVYHVLPCTVLYACACIIQNTGVRVPPWMLSFCPSGHQASGSTTGYQDTDTDTPGTTDANLAQWPKSPRQAREKEESPATTTNFFGSLLRHVFFFLTIVGRLFGQNSMEAPLQFKNKLGNGSASINHCN
jgi:hypothetical protein